MKTEMKTVIASVVVFALVLTAVSGATYSWFSDSEQASINVTAGSIKMETAYSNIFFESEGTPKTNIDLNETKTTALGGSVTVSNYDSASTSQLTITFSGMTTGDSVGFTIKNNVTNTIKINYAGSYSVERASADAIAGTPFVVSMDTAIKSFEAGENPEIVDNVTLTMTDDAVMGESYRITFLFQAIQGNVDPAVLQTKKVPSGSTSILGVKGLDSSEVDTISISMPSFTEDVTIKCSAVSKTPSTFVVSDGSEILGGVDVTITTDAGDEIHSLPGTAKVKMIVDGMFGPGSISIFHEDDPSTPLSGISTDSSSIPGKTIIEFDATEFSAYYAVNSSIAAVGKYYYGSLTDAISEYTEENFNNDCAIILLKNITHKFSSDKETLITVNKNIIIDLNGKSISASTEMRLNNMFYLKSGLLKLIDNSSEQPIGGIESNGAQVTMFEMKDGSLEIVNGNYMSSTSMVGSEWNCTGNVTIDNGTFTLKDSDASMPNMLHINGNSKVIVKDGTFTNIHNNFNSRFFYMYYGTLEILGGEFNSGNGRIASIEESAVMTIKDGAFVAGNKQTSLFELEGTTTIDGGGFESDSRCIADFNGKSFTINGGSFKTIGGVNTWGKPSTAMFDLEDNTGKMIINGGTFEIVTFGKTSGSLFWSYNCNSTSGMIKDGYSFLTETEMAEKFAPIVEINEGTFFFDPTKLVSNSSAVSSEDNRWSVTRNNES